MYGAAGCLAHGTFLFVEYFVKKTVAINWEHRIMNRDCIGNLFKIEFYQACDTI